MSLFDVSDTLTRQNLLGRLKKYPEDLAQTLREYRAEQRKIIALEQNRDYSPQYRAQQSAAMRANLKSSMAGALSDLKRIRKELEQSLRSKQAKALPSYDRATLDSAWARVKPLLDHYQPHQLYAAMSQIAGQSPEVRAALKDGLPLYLQARLVGKGEREVAETTEGILKALRQAEAPYLSESERAVYAEQDELERGLVNIITAENYAEYEGSGKSAYPMAHLPGWEPRSTIDV